MTTIAVVIPSHNRPQEVVAAVASLGEQSAPPDQVIVVDDGSTPPVSPASLPDLPGLTLLRNDPNRGANATRNRGWRAAETDFVAFLDDDDRFLPGKMAAIRRAVAAEPGLDVVYHRAHIVMVNEGVSYDTAPKDLGAVPDPYHELLIGNYLGGTSMGTVRRSRLAEVDGFDEALRSMQDYDLWLRLARAGARFGYIRQALTEYRYVTGSDAISMSVEAHLAAAEAIETKNAAGYATLNEVERRQHRAFILNAATHRALLSGDAKLARRLQRQVLREVRSPAAIANAAITSLGPRAAFLLRSKLDRGPTAARPDKGAK